MKLEYTYGCTCNSLTVDGIEEIHLTDEQRKEAWKKMCMWLAEKDGADLNSLLHYAMEQYGEYSSDDEPCECCGDWVDNYKLEIE